jgi:hypothetical protein
MVHYKQGIMPFQIWNIWGIERRVISIPNTPITVTVNQGPKGGKKIFEDRNHDNTH